MKTLAGFGLFALIVGGLLFVVALLSPARGLFGLAVPLLLAGLIISGLAKQDTAQKESAEKDRLLREQNDLLRAIAEGRQPPPADPSAVPPSTDGPHELFPRLFPKVKPPSSDSPPSS